MLLIFDSQEGYPYDEVRVVLLKGLKNYSFIEGKKLRIKKLFIGNDIDYGVKLLEAEKGNGYNIIYVGGTAATTAAKKALYGQNQ